MVNDDTSYKRGMLIAAGAYFLWGLFPIYWKLFPGIPAPEVLAHRMLWTFPFYLGLYLSGRKGATISALFRSTGRDWRLGAACSALISINWGLYIYAVQSGRVLEGSLAYFLNPLFNVAVGVLFFKEPFPLPLRLAIGCAAAGVIVRLFLAPEPPWIALILATSFCIYGSLKKLSRIPARQSSALEGTVGFLPALIAVIWFRAHAEVPASTATWVLFAGAGVVTGLPLFLFAYSAQRVPYSVMGVLQFLAPTLQFLLGVFAYGEAFGRNDLLSFGLIWCGVATYATYQLQKAMRERLGRRRKTPAPQGQAELE